ncbi:MAG: hypothetical protein O3C70_03430 [Actinomycetota bacterium]|nr:hypothetical protein [Actinomycetota bacterium]
MIWHPWPGIRDDEADVIELSTTSEDLTALDPVQGPLLVVAVTAPEPAALDEGPDSGSEATPDKNDAPPPGPRAPELTEGARRVLGDDGAALLAALGFEASEAATVRLAATVGPVAGRAVLVVGLGPASKVTPETLRRAAGAAVRAAGDVVALATDLATLEVGAGEPSVRLSAVVEGLLLGDYRYDAYRSKPSPRRLTRAVITGVTDGDAVVERARVGAEAAIWVRDLVNTPPKDKRPPVLADTVVAGLADDDVAVRVLDEHELAAGGYGGILGVGGGSTMKPRLVELRWQPEGAQRHVALVGKGITFDTGGYSLKPTAGQETMKMDMAGAAVAAGVVRASRSPRTSCRVMRSA